ncbi:MAG: DUF4231 domain-containing protein [Acidobacteriia bacterium]|nr:DUF4231 domain-containing protein [Terriglobia bacterium]
MTAADNPALGRLEDQIDWYGRKSRYSQRAFKLLKMWTIAIAALVPVLVGFGFNDVRIMAALTASIAVIEGVQQLNQYHANWIAYRSTCESLKHEKYLYLSGAGPYASAPNPVVLLAERIEGTVSQEHAKWISGQEQSTKAGADKPAS